MVSTLEMIRRLHEAGVEFVVIGGVACVAYGSRLVTDDLDVCAPMALENVRKIVACLQDAKPKFRMRPDLPVVTPENRNLPGIKNLYLTSDIGLLDVLGEVPGVGDYATVASDAVVLDILGFPCKFIQFDKLIKAKSTAGRPRDHLAIAQIRAAQNRPDVRPTATDTPAPPADPHE